MSNQETAPRIEESIKLLREHVSGVIRCIRPEGYGFISYDKGAIYFHCQRQDCGTTLTPNDSVLFDIAYYKQFGLQAINVIKDPKDRIVFEI
jgi:cold shock CspA family protein